MALSNPTLMFYGAINGGPAIPPAWIHCRTRPQAIKAALKIVTEKPWDLHQKPMEFQDV